MSDVEIHASGLLSTLVVSLVFAFAGGWAARSLHLPPLVGYLVAGVAVGPFTPGFMADQAIAAELAEIGVALLLFNVGLHFSPADLWRARKIAIPGGLVQVLVTSLIGFAVGQLLLGLPVAGALVCGLSLAIASTAVATRALAERGRLDTPIGRIALGWLVVQDIVVVLALVLLPLLIQPTAATPGQWAAELGQVALQIIGFLVAMTVIGRRLIPWVLGHVARGGSRELFTLAVIVIALGIAASASVFFGVSVALGAFLAGVVLGESDLSHQAAADTLPIQQVFTVLFFVSVGMLFDPATLLRMPLEVATMLGAIALGAGLVTLTLLLILRCPPETAALVGAAFAQIGEFSFILTELALAQNLIGRETRDLVLAAALLSILFNPMMFRLAAPIASALAGFGPLARWRAAGDPAHAPEPISLNGHAILIGHGRVGSLVAAALTRHGLPFIVIESDRAQAEKLRAAGLTVIYGDATRPDVLAAAAPRSAKLLVVALPDAFHARGVITLARTLNPDIGTVVRTHSDQEAAYLTEEAKVGLVVMGEREVALSMSDFVLQSLGVAVADAQATVNSLR